MQATLQRYPAVERGQTDRQQGFVLKSLSTYWFQSQWTFQSIFLNSAFAVHLTVNATAIHNGAETVDPHLLMRQQYMCRMALLGALQ
jgi:hypothetical protein